MRLSPDLVNAGDEGLVRRRRKRYAPAASAGERRHLEEAEDAEIIGALRRESRSRSRRSTVMLALTMAMKTCELRECNVEYQEGNKKVRLRISDE